VRVLAPRTARHSRRACALLATLSAAGVTACGATVSTSGFTGPAHAVAQRVSDYQADVAASNAQKVCRDDLATAVRARLTAAGGCVRALKHQLQSVDDYEATVVKNGIAVTGATATARVQSTWSGKRRVTTLRLVRQGGSWRIAGLQ
jgi:hypothetical protein